MLSHLIDLLFPPLCPTCKKHTHNSTPQLCLNCLHTLEAAYQKAKFYDIQPLYGASIQAPKVIYSFDKSSPIQTLLHRLKYKHRLDLIPLILQPFIEWEKLLPGPYEVLIPVPLYSGRKRKRGYNQSEELAKMLSQKLQVPYRIDLLERIKHTKPQAIMSRDQRTWNLEGAFKAIPDPTLIDKRVLIIDDVLTTGSTLRACTQGFSEQNPQTKIDVLAIASVLDA